MNTGWAQIMHLRYNQVGYTKIENLAGEIQNFYEKL